MTDTAENKGRRDFIVVASNTMIAVGAAAVAYPLINQMNPAADTLALASIEVNVGALAEGQAITVKWRGKPVFIRHRTAEEISAANDTLIDDHNLENLDYIVLHNDEILKLDSDSKFIIISPSYEISTKEIILQNGTKINIE